MRVRIIAIGKIKKSWIAEGIHEYWKRVPDLAIVEVKDASKAREMEKILTLIKPNEKLVVLSERGQMLTSIEFAKFIEQESGQPIAFVIGGPEGTAAELDQRAYKVLSLSGMTFPHEMARLFLVEQIYRAKTILQNANYHK